MNNVLRNYTRLTTTGNLSRGEFTAAKRRHLAPRVRLVLVHSRSERLSTWRQRALVYVAASTLSRFSWWTAS